MTRTLKLLTIIKLFPVGILALIAIVMIALGILNGELMTLVITILFGIAYIGNYMVSRKNLKILRKGEAPSSKLALISFVCSLLGLFIFVLLCIVEGTGKYILATIVNVLIVGISVFEMIVSKKENSTSNTIPSTTPSPDLNKLVEYKELLDMGAITQKEYEEKKKQILNQ